MRRGVHHSGDIRTGPSLAPEQGGQQFPSAGGASLSFLSPQATSIPRAPATISLGHLASMMGSLGVSSDEATDADTEGEGAAHFDRRSYAAPQADREGARRGRLVLEERAPPSTGLDDGLDGLDSGLPDTHLQEHLREEAHRLEQLNQEAYTRRETALIREEVRGTRPSSTYAEFGPVAAEPILTVPARDARPQTDRPEPARHEAEHLQATRLQQTQQEVIALRKQLAARQLAQQQTAAVQELLALRQSLAGADVPGPNGAGLL